MKETFTLRSEIWRQRLRKIRTIVRRTVPFASGVLAALLAVLIYSLLNPPPPPLTLRDVNQTVINAMASATPPPPFSSLVYQIIQPSLVLIQTEPPGSDSSVAKDFNNVAFQTTANETESTGVLINAEGDILTSLHVVAEAPNILVTFADGTQAIAEIIGAQPEIDIAVLRANQLPEQFAPAVLGNPNAVRIGDEAFVVGHPFSLYGSMSAGVVSGLDRTFVMPDTELEITGLIQVDAAMNPGNSGGPLLNRYGQVVGIVTGILNPTGDNVFIGIGFAVPITTAGGAAGLPPY